MTVKDRPRKKQSIRGNEQLEAGVDTKQYTIKGIEAETLDKVRFAARKEGMKVGAWISRRLSEAANQALEEKSSPSDTFQALQTEIAKLDSCRQEDRERLIAIQKGLADIVQAQHSMMTSLLGK